MKINPEWVALEGKPHLVQSLNTDSFKSVNLNPMKPKNELSEYTELIPNLDCETVSPEDMRKLCDFFRKVSDGYRQLSNYSEAKADAMECRGKGNIALALEFEATCDQIYESLPSWAKSW